MIVVGQCSLALCIHLASISKYTDRTTIGSSDFGEVCICERDSLNRHVKLAPNLIWPPSQFVVLLESHVRFHPPDLSPSIKKAHKNPRLLTGRSFQFKKQAALWSPKRGLISLYDIDFTRCCGNLSYWHDLNTASTNWPSSTLADDGTRNFNRKF